MPYIHHFFSSSLFYWWKKWEGMEGEEKERKRKSARREIFSILLFLIFLSTVFLNRAFAYAFFTIYWMNDFHILIYFCIQCFFQIQVSCCCYVCVCVFFLEICFYQTNFIWCPISCLSLIWTKNLFAWIIQLKSPANFRWRQKKISRHASRHQSWLNRQNKKTNSSILLT